MRKALFELARIAAEVVVSNEKLLVILKQNMLNAITQLAGELVGLRPRLGHSSLLLPLRPRLAVLALHQCRRG